MKKQWDEKLGICIKELDKTVIFQNEVCHKLCETQVGEKCIEGCMESFANSGQEGLFNEGVKKVGLVKLSHSSAEAVVINDGENLTSILYPGDQKYERQMDFFKKHGLTKSEMGIMSLVVQGHSNIRIAEKLLISKATLRTHLNNIYKKLPENYRGMDLRSKLS